MANPKSSAFYTRSKGLTEQALAELGYKDTIVFRPGFLSNTQRSDSRFGESALLYALLFPYCSRKRGPRRSLSGLDWSLVHSLTSALGSKSTWVELVIP